MKIFILSFFAVFIICCNSKTEKSDQYVVTNKRLFPIKSTHSILGIKQLDSLSSVIPDSIKLPHFIFETPAIFDSLFGFVLKYKYRHIKEEIMYVKIYKEIYICEDYNKYKSNIVGEVTDSGLVTKVDTCIVSKYYYPDYEIVKHLETNEISILGNEVIRLNYDSLHLYKGKDEGIKFYFSFFNILKKNELLSCYTKLSNGKFTEFTTFNHNIILYVPDDGFILDSYIDGKLLYKGLNNVYLIK